MTCPKCQQKLTIKKASYTHNGQWYHCLPCKIAISVHDIDDSDE